MVATAMIADSFKPMVKKAMSDFEYFAKYCVKIRRKDGTVGPFVLNNVQRKLLRIVESKKPVRVIILKARQMGISTFIEIYLLWRMLRDGGVNVLMLAHERDAASYILGMTRFAVAHLPDWFTRLAGVETEYFTKYEISFKHNNSRLMISSADSKEPGRSRTLHYVHFCLHEDSLIILADGNTKPIKDIAIGDLVITSTGKIAPVKSKFYVGRKPTIKVQTWLSNEFVAMTPEHKVLTDSGWKRCSELTTKDYIQLPGITISGKLATYDFHLPNKDTTHGTRHREYASIPLDFDFGFLLGYYLAEGSVKHQHGYNDRYCEVSFAHHVDEQYYKRIGAYLQRQFGKSCKTTRREGKRAVTHVYDTFLAHLIAEICGVAENKHVPEWFFDATPEFVDGVIAGYFSGDGSKTMMLVNGKYKENRITATSIHEKIARQIRRLLLARNFGVAALYYYAKRYRYDKETKPVYVLGAFSDFGGKIRELIGLEGVTACQEFIKKYKQIDGKWFVRVKSIEPYEVADVYDIEVDDESHDFETPIGIVSNSEAGFYDNAETLMRAAFAAIPDMPNTVVFIESTGNGPAGWYYDTFMRALSGKNEYEAVFFPWYECEEYRRPVPDGVEVACPPSLQKLYEEGVIDREQLYWRQWTIENKYNGDEFAFAVEFPATVSEGFLQESANVFSPQAVQARLNEVESVQPEVGYLEDLGPGVRFIEAPGERLTIYKRPEPGRTYVIGADVGSGVVVNREGDASCADVLDAVTGEQVAHLHEVVEPTLYARDLFLLGKFYNTALIAVEITGGHGLSVVNWLRDNGYTALYQRRVYDKVSGTFVNRLGWDTTRRTKAVMIDALRASFYNGEVVVNHPDTLREMLTFIKDGSKLEAVQGAHDDRVMSLAVSVMALREYGQALKAFSGQPVQQQQQQMPEQNIRMRSRVPVKEYHPELGAYW